MTTSMSFAASPCGGARHRRRRHRSRDPAGGGGRRFAGRPAASDPDDGTIWKSDVIDIDVRIVPLLLVGSSDPWTQNNLNLS